jgi:dolichol-phosphate mannosyltransferase
MTPSEANTPPVQLSVIIPVLNEEANVDQLYQRLTQVMVGMHLPYELVFVNDGSTDQTLLRVRNLRQADKCVRYLDFSRNFGHQVAVSAGIDYSRGETIVIIDADLQDPPELIPRMYQMLAEGYEVVYAKRLRRKGETFFKRFTAKLFYRLFNWGSNIQIPLDTGDFRIISNHIVRVLRNMPEKHKFLRGQISWIGFRQTYIEYERDARAGGKSNYPLRKMLRFALDGLTGFSTLPLKIATLTGFAISGTAFVFILVIIVTRIFSKELGIYIQPGWASTLIVVLFLGGIQLIGIGILGEYIGRVYENIKGRPLYILRQSSDDEEKTA